MSLPFTKWNMVFWQLYVSPSMEELKDAVRSACFTRTTSNKRLQHHLMMLNEVLLQENLGVDVS